MSEHRRKIAALVVELRAELAQTPKLDVKHRAEIERELAVLESALAAEKDRGPDDSPFHTPLEKAMAAVEQTNPALYKVAMNLVNALAEMGI